jgi:hypothetical protein
VIPVPCKFAYVSARLRATSVPPASATSSTATIAIAQVESGTVAAAVGWALEPAARAR